MCDYLTTKEHTTFILNVLIYIFVYPILMFIFWELNFREMSSMTGM